MTITLSEHQIRKEARLLYTLLDAVEDNGMLSAGPDETRWREAKRRIVLSGDYESEAELFYALLTEIDSAGVISDTWIQRRWLTIKGRIADAN
jgi:hypothetical protein